MSFLDLADKYPAPFFFLTIIGIFGVVSVLNNLIYSLRSRKK